MCGSNADINSAGFGRLHVQSHGTDRTVTQEKPVRTTLSTFFAIALSATAAAQQTPAGLARPETEVVADVFTLPAPSQVHLGGLLGDRFGRSERNRLLNVDEVELLAGFRHRPGKQAWIGEHVGKWLHAASLAYANSGDKSLRAKLDRVVVELLKTQEADGYLGTYTPDKRFGLYANADWDVWVHKYDLLGLLAYYQFTGNKPALQSCRRMGDLLINTFGSGRKSIISAGTHVGMASTSVMEPIVLLYRATGDKRYLDFAKYIVASWEEPNGPHIISSLLKYRAVNKVANGKAYEMLSNLNGLCELYRSTGEKQYLEAVQIAWEDIAKNRLYITGSGSSGEHWQDDFHLPNGEGANICETCVTVTWEQLNVQLLRLTGEAKYADQLERSVYNHLLGAQKPTADAWAYYTPLIGHKPYGSSTNCCLSSGPRGVALLPTFVYSGSAKGPVINLFTNSDADVSFGKKGLAHIHQETDYPVSDKVRITVTPKRGPKKFALLIRGYVGPYISNVGALPIVSPLFFKPNVNYRAIEQDWSNNQSISFGVDNSVHMRTGDHENAGKAAITVGPLVLAVDEGHNPELKPIQRVALAESDPAKFKLRKIDGASISNEPVYETDGLQTVGAGEPKPVKLRLTPYYAAGQDGSRYSVWLPLRAGTPPVGASLFYLSDESWSNAGNVEGSIADDDTGTFRVTFDGTEHTAAWFAVSLPKPTKINRVVYAHGHSFHDGGWFDASAGKPKIEVQRISGGPWETIATLESYPETTAISGRGLRDGRTFTVKFASVEAVAIRVTGKPAHGDTPGHSFASCAELQGFFDP